MNSLTVHTAIADVAGTGRTLDPNQFQFLLKHSVCPLVQLQVPAKHPTRALASAIHYQLIKRMFTKLAASQTDGADLFQVERKKFFTSIIGREYKAGKKQTKAEKTKMAGTSDKEKTTPGPVALCYM